MSYLSYNASLFQDDNPGQCPVCFIFYDDTEQRPRNLPCGHTFCTMCINQLKRPSRIMQNIVVMCPTCRSTHNVPRAGNFPICYSLEAVIMSLRNVNVSGSMPSEPGKPTGESFMIPVLLDFLSHPHHYDTSVT